MSKTNNLPAPRASRQAGGANLGFENQMWAAADKLRGHMDASEYKHVVLGLIFLKYISDAFQAKYKQLEATKDTEYTDPENRDEYAAANISWVPKEARWAKLQSGDKLVDEFEKIAFAFDEQIEKNTNETKTLNSLRDTLLPELISGELRVPDAEKFAREADL